MYKQPLRDPTRVPLVSGSVVRQVTQSCTSFVAYVCNTCTDGSTGVSESITCVASSRQKALHFLRLAEYTRVGAWLIAYRGRRKSAGSVSF